MKQQQRKILNINLYLRTGCQHCTHYEPKMPQPPQPIYPAS
ncbi:MAG TPA: hypothetical protein VJG90_02060 [Candidatus Nanoarchaeia archaeon]|nr:hypothetical protein [Candidatus Nanoarchaeia archaeon]